TVIPFVILIYFGSAFIISDTIHLRAASLTTMEEELAFSEGLVVILTYVGLSGWLWLPTASEPCVPKRNSFDFDRSGFGSPRSRRAVGSISGAKSVSGRFFGIIGPHASVVGLPAAWAEPCWCSAGSRRHWRLSGDQ